MGAMHGVMLWNGRTRGWTPSASTSSPPHVYDCVCVCYLLFMIIGVSDGGGDDDDVSDGDGVSDDGGGGSSVSDGVGRVTNLCEMPLKAHEMSCFSIEMASICIQVSTICIYFVTAAHE